MAIAGGIQMKLKSFTFGMVVLVGCAIGISLGQTPAPKVAPIPAPKAAAAKPPAAPATSQIDSVIESVKAGLSEGIIMRTLQRENKPTILSPADLVKLKNAGVSENIISVMMDPSAGPSRGAPTAVAVPVPAAPAAATPSARATAPTPRQSVIADEPVVQRDSLTNSKVDPQELNKYIKERYDGKTFAVATAGLLAGEYQKADLGIGSGRAGLVLYHFHKSIDPLPKNVNAGDLIAPSISRLNRIDDRTFTDVKSGLNVTKLEKGEQVRVNKFYMRSNYIDLYLEPLDPSHLKDLDINKASQKRTTIVGGGQANTNVSVAGFGLRCVFFFDKEKVLQQGDLKAITDEIGKYLIDPVEAEKLKSQEQNIDIEIGLTEGEVIKRLGQPLRSLTTGTQKSLKYKDLTVTLKDGKVTDVKLE